ncbi:hypothetical protein PENTCL1PPCAC_7871 [Pristionchus entomophagus]|uniref:Uncharacterized protein n=1 Tax=Pristionchus entomophagus TaxID=358040 RepID=A0AAV5SR64_9BILA|nr:hypothetical protein PENTCL1PPCAC_7871 [Pristionchus entomophagus]
MLHLLAYKECESRTDQLLFEFDEEADHVVWWTGKTLNVSKEEYSEDEAAIAFEMVGSSEMDLCYDRLCSNKIEKSLTCDAVPDPEKDRKMVYCHKITSAISRLIRIAYIGWGEEKLMAHKDSPSRWFSLRYPYQNVINGERGKYVRLWNETLRSAEGKIVDYELLALHDAPLPLNPREFSEQREMREVSLYYKRKPSDAMIRDQWIKFKTISVPTERFSDEKAQEWKDVRRRFAKYPNLRDSLIDSLTDSRILEIMSREGYSE